MGGSPSRVKVIGPLVPYVAGFRAELGLALRRDKCRIVQLREGGEGFDFLGFHHRLVRGRGARHRHLTFLARWPATETIQQARDRVRELTARQRLVLPVERIVRDVNAFLRGWAAYYRYGNSARRFDQISDYALMRVALFVATRHQRPRRYGFAVAYGSPDRLGLIRLTGTVVPPRPNWGWRGARPNAAG